ncbi:uncharacterized protein LOC135496717 [Lineus longissimus]|uniref:uncharacterized protein LOC135496717 n=1 Tax=Lineus longissimus TaxID=88925 RepID=UPI002B4C3FBA
MSNTVNVIHIKASPEEAAENLLDTLKGELQRKGDILCTAWTELHTLLSQPGVVTVEDPAVLSTLQDRGTLLSTTWNELYNLIAAYQTELSSRESQVVTAWAQIQNKEQLAGELRKKVATLEEELRKKNESMSTTQATITQLLSQQKKYDGVSDDKQARIDKFQADMEDRETVLSNLTLENLALTAKVEELESHVQNLDPNRSEREETLEKYRSEMLRLTEENGSLTEKLKVAKNGSEPVVKGAVSQAANGVKEVKLIATPVQSVVKQAEKKRTVQVVRTFPQKLVESKGGQGDATVTNVTTDQSDSGKESTDTPLRKTRSAGNASPACASTKEAATPSATDVAVESITPRSSGRRRKAEETQKSSENTPASASKAEASPMRSKRGRIIKAKLKNCAMGAHCPFCKNHVNVTELKKVVDGQEDVVIDLSIDEGKQLEINSQRKEADKKNQKILSAERARTIVGCVECGKLRVVYSWYKPSEEEKNMLEVYLGEISYMCGFPLFTEDCELYKKFVVREQMSCCSPMETSYYRAGRFSPVCFHCGTSEDLADNKQIQALRLTYAVVRPICQPCLDLGLEPCTRAQLA